MTFEMSKHVALNDIHLVVLTVCLRNNYRCWVCGCELNRSQCLEYYSVNEFRFHNFSPVSIIKTQFTAHLMFAIPNLLHALCSLYPIYCTPYVHYTQFTAHLMSTTPNLLHTLCSLYPIYYTPYVHYTQFTAHLIFSTPNLLHTLCSLYPIYCTPYIHYTHFTAHLIFIITAATCGERSRVFRLVNYKSTQGLSREMFGWIPAMRVQWTPQCICNSFNTPAMLVAHMHSCVCGSDSRVRCCRPHDICSVRRRGEICLSASKLDRHLLSGTFKNVLHMCSCGLESRPGLSKSVNVCIKAAGLIMNCSSVWRSRNVCMM
jgi:hypothetical protein